jgi:hypothetical protein
MEHVIEIGAPKPHKSITAGLSEQFSVPAECHSTGRAILNDASDHVAAFDRNDLRNAILAPCSKSLLSGLNATESIGGCWETLVSSRPLSAAKILTLRPRLQRRERCRPG